jgi:hypothetical protein
VSEGLERKKPKGKGVAGPSGFDAHRSDNQDAHPYELSSKEGEETTEDYARRMFGVEKGSGSKRKADELSQSGERPGGSGSRETCRITGDRSKSKRNADMFSLFKERWEGEQLDTSPKKGESAADYLKRMDELLNPPK